MFHLYRTLAGHSAAVRCITALPDGTAVSGGLDGNVIIWTSPSPKIIKIGAGDFVYALTASTDGKFILVGSKDKKAYVLDVASSAVVGTLVGHQGPVSSVAFIDGLSTSCPWGRMVVTGAWDGTLKIWDGQNEVHSADTAGAHAVCLCVVPGAEVRVVSGSQDKELKFWRMAGQGLVLEKAVKNAHDDIIRQICMDGGGAGVWTCGNDGLVKLWSLQGDNMITMCPGSGAFVFGVASAAAGQVVTASDDGVLAVIDGQTAAVRQTLNHGKTLWGVCVTAEGLIVTACADGIVRMFSSGDQRASAEEVAAFEAIGTAAAGALPDIKTIPNVAMLPMTTGKKSGEVKMFSDGAEIFAYQWDGRDWALLGTVTGGAGSKPAPDAGAGAGGKVKYSGDAVFPAGEYDYVFDVEIGESRGRSSKLPVNRSDNKLVIAENFCAREDIDRTVHAADIVAFLDKNVTGSTEREAARPAEHLLPIVFSEVNWPGLKKKLLEDVASKTPPAGLEPTLTKVGSSQLSTAELDILTKGLLPFVASPASRSFVVVDLWRMLLSLGSANDELQKAVYINTVLDAMMDSPGNLGMALCGVKYLGNITAHGAGRVQIVSVGSLAEKTVSVLETVVKRGDLHKAKSGIYAVASFIHNVSIAGDLKSRPGLRDRVRTLAELVEGEAKPVLDKLVLAGLL